MDGWMGWKGLDGYQERKVDGGWTRFRFLLRIDLMFPVVGNIVNRSKGVKSIQFNRHTTKYPEGVDCIILSFLLSFFSGPSPPLLLDLKK